MSISTSETLTSVDPRTGQLLGHIVGTAAGDLSAACERAAIVFEASMQAVDDPAGPAAEAVKLLGALADELTGRRGELLEMLDRETALGPARLTGEHARTVFQLRAFAEAADTPLLRQPIIDTSDPQRMPPRTDQRRLNVPIGPVAVFAASNFPLAFGILGGDTASALAAGCPVVVKAHPAQPLSGQLIAEITMDAIVRAGVDPGWLQVVCGASPEIGLQLVNHPAIAAVGFTGSLGGGTALVQAAAQRPVPIQVYAEMGSLNPSFVGPSAAESRADQIGDGWAGTLSASAGQLCTKPGLLIVPDASAAQRVTAAARHRLENDEIIPLLVPRLAESFTRLANRAAEVPGVRSTWVTPGRLGQGTYVSAMILEADAATVLAQQTLTEEMFGPAGIVVTCPPGQVGDFAHAMRGSLTAAVFADDADRDWTRTLIPVLRARAGRLIYNRWPTGVSVGAATVHGGPWPATSAPAATSVGLTAAWRFLRPVAHEDFPADLLPPPLRYGQ